MGFSLTLSPISMSACLTSACALTITAGFFISSAITQHKSVLDVSVPAENMSCVVKEICLALIHNHLGFDKINQRKLLDDNKQLHEVELMLPKLGNLLFHARLYNTNHDNGFDVVTCKWNLKIVAPLHP